MFNKFNKVAKIIKSSKKVLLHLHPSPDGDSAGSALAAMYALKQLKKQVTVISGDSDLPQFLSVLPGFKEIVPKNFFQVDLNQFDLFLILDSSSKNQISKFGEVVFPKKLKTIVIDHHPSNEKFASVNIIDDQSPATCQIIHHLFKKLNIKITPNIAANIFVGLYTDTGGFKYPRTTQKTLSIATECSKIYPKFPELIFEIENHNQPDRLKFLSIMLSSIENYYSDHVAVASISYDDIQKYDINSSTFNNSEIPNILKSVVGWDIGVSLIEHQPNITKISMRTRNPNLYDLSKICATTGFGGGHKSAAGATLNLPLAEAKKTILKIIQKLHPELK
jgi:phosphoesterase RecJ-like protein